MRKKIIIFSLLALALLLVSAPALAICPVCTVAVIGGVGLSRWLGIDDTVTGLWVGGVTVSLIMWTIDWLNRKNIRFLFRKILIIALYYGFIVVPLVWWDVIGHPLNKFWGMDKLLFGIIFGSILFTAGAWTYFYMKKKNDGKPHFPFEKVVLSVAPLIVFSVIFYFLIAK